jgi:hypothetical protein
MVLTEALLERLIVAVERIALALESRTPAGGLHPDAGELLAEIERAVADRVFTSFALCDFVDVAMDSALGASIVKVAGALSPRKLGHKLKAFENEPIDGRILRRVGRQREGLSYQVLRQENLRKTGTFR